MSAKRTVERSVLELPPGASLERSPDEEFPSFRWRDGESGLRFQASGAVLVHSGSGDFSSAHAARSHLVEHDASSGLDADVSGSLPMWLHAIPFRPLGGGAEPSWTGWPNALAWVPRTIRVELPDGRRFEVTHRTKGGAHASVEPTGSPAPRSIEAPNDAEGARARYVARVGKARETIRAGSLRKVVVARAERVTAPVPFDARAQFEALSAGAPRAVAFAWQPSPGRAWVGATPEVLARAEGGVLRTSAIAGTTLAAVDPDGTRLAADAKTLEEHGLVVDAIRRALADVMPDVWVASQPCAKRSERLVHLETTFRGTLDRADLLDVCERLHPTPALGGAPRAPALAWLDEHESLERGYYGAPIGWTAPNGDGVLAVGIRAARLEGREAVLFAGAGIVADSDPEMEWQETENKLALARTTLRADSTGEPHGGGRLEPATRTAEARP